MDSSEVTIKVAQVIVAAFKSYLFDGAGGVFYQLGGSDHSYIPQVLSKCLPDFAVE